MGGSMVFLDPQKLTGMCLAACGPFCVFFHWTLASLVCGKAASHWLRQGTFTVNPSTQPIRETSSDNNGSQVKT